jgi:DinB superfamily
MKILNWTNTIDSITQLFHERFQTLSEADLNWKPDGKTWSIAQNIDHLIKINLTYYPIIKSLRAGTYQLPWIGKFGFMVTFFGKVILKSVSPDRRKKMKTFPLWEPSRSNIEKDILHRFSQHQEELKALIQSSKDLLVKGAVISSPANKNIVYSLEAAFDIMVTHEQRHLQQATEVEASRKLVMAKMIDR